MLSDSESEQSGSSLHRLTINEHYAKAFAYKKEREELERLKEKYGSDGEDDGSGSDGDEEDSEEGETEDEDGEELTPAMDAAILRTLGRIKRKDPSIYDASKDVFEEEQQKVVRGSGYVSLGLKSRAPKDKAKAVTMRQLMLDSALNPSSRSPSPRPLAHAEEQRVLREETIAAFHGALGGSGGSDDVGKAEDHGDSSDNDDDFLVPREKTEDELLKEEEEYRAFLEREVGDGLAELVTVEEGVLRDEEEPENEKKRKTEQGKGDLNQQQTDREFLMNYILNRGWIDRSTRRLPTYNEVTGTKNRESGLSTGHDDASDQEENNAVDGSGEELEEEEFDEIVDRFESSYNFRFEEPDAAVIKTYPRNLPSLVRREDTTRKDARERRKQRKAEEKLKKKEEVKRLKALKMKELRAKLERIGHEGGKIVDESEALQNLDLEGEWDPEAHDEQMAGIYNSGDDRADAEKPRWDDDIDIGDILVVASPGPGKKVKKKKKKGKESDGVDAGVDVADMDADVERVDDEEWDGTEEMRKRKLDEYMEEIYGLEFNDIVGDLPTRFKYAQVRPQSFALTPADILMATDSELNQYLSVKKYAPYQKGSRWDGMRGERLRELKQTLSSRMPDTEAPTAAKRKGKKERMKMRDATAAVEGEATEGTLGGC